MFYLVMVLKFSHFKIFPTMITQNCVFNFMEDCLQQREIGKLTKCQERKKVLIKIKTTLR